jgi:hypothetical protein
MQLEFDLRQPGWRWSRRNGYRRFQREFQPGHQRLGWSNRSLYHWPDRDRWIAGVGRKYRQRWRCGVQRR